MTLVKQPPWKWVVVVGIAGILMTGWLMTRPSPNALRTSVVSRADIEQVVLTSGTVIPVRQVNVGAQVSGQLKSLRVGLGDRVSKGDLLAEIDPKLQEIQVLEAEAGLKNIQAQRNAQEAQLRLYKRELSREAQLRKDDASSVADYETAASRVDTTQANIQALDAQLQQAEVQLETARANLDYTRIIAPMDGKVIAVVTQEGQTVVSVQSAPTILVLADLDQMLVQVRISEADVMHVRPGQMSWFSVLGTPGRKFHTRLQSVEPAPPFALIANDVSSGSTAPATSGIYYNGLLKVDNPDQILMPMMTAQVSIVLGRVQQVLAVPVAALNGPDRDGKYTVEVVHASSLNVEQRLVTVGLSDDVLMQITSGLSEGDIVVVGRDRLASDGAEG